MIVIKSKPETCFETYAIFDESQNLYLTMNSVDDLFPILYTKQNAMNFIKGLPNLKVRKFRLLEIE